MSMFTLDKNNILLVFQIFKDDLHNDTEGRVKTKGYNSVFNIQNELFNNLS